jgi:hypothetical protein
MKSWRWTALAATAALAACGGSGGSSGASSGIVSTGITGPAPGANFALSDGGTLTMNADGTATLTDAGVNGDAPTVLHPAAPGDPATAPAFAGGTALAAPSVVLERMGPAAGLSASDFGVWNIVQGGALGPANFYAGGQPTASGLLPPQGMGITATYNGSYIANLAAATIYEGNPIAAGPFSGSVQISANFDNRALSASFGGLLAAQISMGSTYDPVTGAYVIGGNTASNFAFGTFTMNGRFYGAPLSGQAPPETVGTISGTLGSATGTYTGSFGAHR